MQITIGITPYAMRGLEVGERATVKHAANKAKLDAKDCAVTVNGKDAAFSSTLKAGDCVLLARAAKREFTEEEIDNACAEMAEQAKKEGFLSASESEALLNRIKERANRRGGSLARPRNYA